MKPSSDTFIYVCAQTCDCIVMVFNSVAVRLCVRLSHVRDRCGAVSRRPTTNNTHSKLCMWNVWKGGKTAQDWIVVIQNKICSTHCAAEFNIFDMIRLFLCVICAILHYEFGVGEDTPNILASTVRNLCAHGWMQPCRVEAPIIWMLTTSRGGIRS